MLIQIASHNRDHRRVEVSELLFSLFVPLLLIFVLLFYIRSGSGVFALARARTHAH